MVSTSKALLDFESSIESELQAELLTGKQLNLERARAASLVGDQATLAKELTSQAGTFTEFSKMGVVQQDALAKAFGMSSDRLSDILFKQQIQNRTASQLRAAGEDELASILEKQTAQQKFNDTIEKLKNVFTDVASSLMPVFEAFSGILSIAGKIIKIIEPVIGTITGAIAGFAVGGPVGALIGGALGAGSDISRAASRNTSMQDGIIGPGAETIVSGPKGSITLDKQDSMIVGTSLVPNNTSVRPSNTELISEVKAMRQEMSTLLSKIANKESVVELDGNRVGRFLASSTSQLSS